MLLQLAAICEKSCTVGDGIAVFGICIAVAVVGWAFFR